MPAADSGGSSVADAEPEGAPARRRFRIALALAALVGFAAGDSLRPVDAQISVKAGVFAIDAYRIIKRVPGHSSITFEFRADQPGTFTFYCNLTTDAACKDMRGTLSVRSK